VQRIGLLPDVERVHDQRPGASLGGARSSESTSPVAGVGERPSWRRGSTVGDRVDEQHVVLCAATECEVVLDAKVDHAPTRSLILTWRTSAVYVAYSGMSWRDGSSSANRASDTGAASSEAAAEPRRRLGVGAVDTDDELFVLIGTNLGEPSSYTLTRGKCLELLGIDGDRTRDGRRAPTRMAKHIPADRDVEQGRARIDEHAAPPLAVKADEVVREQSFVDRCADRRGQDAPPTRFHPRNVDEVRQDRLRRALSNELRSEIQVVVVEEDDRLGARYEPSTRHRRMPG
jgi:hypothetical protein